MGGDHAPSVVVDGAVVASRHLAVRIALVDQPRAIEQEIAAVPARRQ